MCRDHFAISVLSDEKSVAKGAAESKIKSGFGCPRSFLPLDKHFVFLPLDKQRTLFAIAADMDITVIHHLWPYFGSSMSLSTVTDRHYLDRSAETINYHH